MKIDRARFLSLVLAGSSAQLIACGGGSSEASSDTTPQRTVATTSVGVRVQPTVECTGWDSTGECVQWLGDQTASPVDECVSWDSTGECIQWASSPTQECVNWDSTGECIGWM